MEPNGTLENIKTYAKLTFNNDVDQEVAFIHIVSAFVVKLFDKVVNNGKTRKRYRNSQTKLDFTQPVMVVHNNQFNAVLVDAKILEQLQEMNNNESVQSVSLQHLQLPESTLVTIKSTGTDKIISVPLSSIKLSPQLHGERIERNKELQKLINVVNKHPTNKQSNQFIGLLHGSGGAGKSKVINAVRNYAKDCATLSRLILINTQ